MEEDPYAGMTPDQMHEALKDKDEAIAHSTAQVCLHPATATANLPLRCAHTPHMRLGTSAVLLTECAGSQCN